MTIQEALRGLKEVRQLVQSQAAEIKSLHAAMDKAYNCLICAPCKCGEYDNYSCWSCQAIHAINEVH